MDALFIHLTSENQYVILVFYFLKRSFFLMWGGRKNRTPCYLLTLVDPKFKNLPASKLASDF